MGELGFRLIKVQSQMFPKERTHLVHNINSFLMCSNNANEKIISITDIRKSTEILVHRITTGQLSGNLTPMQQLFNSLTTPKLFNGPGVLLGNLTFSPTIEGGNKPVHKQVQLMHINVTLQGTQNTTLRSTFKVAGPNPTHRDVSSLKTGFD